MKNFKIILPTPDEIRKYSKNDKEEAIVNFENTLSNTLGDQVADTGVKTYSIPVRNRIETIPYLGVTGSGADKGINWSVYETIGACAYSVSITNLNYPKTEEQIVNDIFIKIISEVERKEEIFIELEEE